jgi:hypothetical protein
MVFILRSVSGLLPALVSAGVCVDRGIEARRRGRAARSVAWFAVGPFLACAAGAAPFAIAAAAVLVFGGRGLYAFAGREDGDLATPEGRGGRPGEDADTGSLGSDAHDDERPDP